MSSALKQRLEAGGKAKPFWIVGPCVVESPELCLTVAAKLKDISETHDIPVVFKASFDKANRTSHSSFRGPGIEKGLAALLKVKKEFELPILTDVHEASQASAVAEVADILQIPAFLCRQTDLLVAACKTGRLVNVKKGQFVAPSNVKNILDKLKAAGSAGHWITERGVSFGYQRLVVDFAALPEMQTAGADVILDITHSVQLPGGEGSVTGGIREAIPYLSRAGAAAGYCGFFAETHPDPSQAKSDASNAWPLDQLESLMLKNKQIAEASYAL